MRPVSVFFMAHQDDEFGVFHQIELEVALGRRVFCMYVTDGDAGGVGSRRDAESRRVLARLGIESADILFLGRALSIGDGRLHLKGKVLQEWLACFIDAHSGLEAVFVPAWEGGHPDHDMLHAVVVDLLEIKGLPINVWQYPLYNARNCRGPLFRAMYPLPENGSVVRRTIPWRDRLRYVRLCLSYPSQWRSWLGLLPFVGAHYLFHGVQYLQGVCSARLEGAPHPRPLYYEKRHFLDYPSMQKAIAGLRHARQREGCGTPQSRMRASL